MSRGVLRAAVLVALAALVVLLVVPWRSGPVTATPAAAGSGQGLRVMTWNVRTNKFDAPDWAPVVAELLPDVVGFQEICAGDAQELADLLRAEHGVDYEVALGSAREALYESCATTAAGPIVFGQAVLSRVPLLDPVNTVLPDGDGLDEPRGFLAVTLDVPGAPVRLLTTHITISNDVGDDDATAARRRALQGEQIDVVARAASGSGERVLLVGDLNVGPDDPRLDVVERAGFLEVDRDRNSPTGNNRVDDPGSAAEYKIDYVFVKGMAQVGDPETFWVPSSDHRPLVATLRP